MLLDAWCEGKNLACAGSPLIRQEAIQELYSGHIQSPLPGVTVTHCHIGF